ncbi:MAG: NAD-dependent epimerase/dehydratase family protein [Ketobacter sp.]|nr:MAG: NAD-dependent epimerase/dehydratase family protein [Ketobacter sp.]
MKIKPELLIVGATGYIGRELFGRAKIGHKVAGTSTNGCADTIALKLESVLDFDFDRSLLSPSTVLIITAAISSPDICANQKDFAWSVNVDGAAKLITCALDAGARVIFFSSDTVYGERDDVFSEDAHCHPAGEYAFMKNEIERRFTNNPLFKTVRLSYVFSRADKFTKYLVQSAKADVEVEIFHPFYRSIVYRTDVIEGALALADRWEEFPQGVINFGGPEVISRVEFAECLQRTALRELKFQVVEPDSEFFENRPRNIAMASPILKDLLGREPHTLEEAIGIEFGMSNVSQSKQGEVK